MTPKEFIEKWITDGSPLCHEMVLADLTSLMQLPGREEADTECCKQLGCNNGFNLYEMAYRNGFLACHDWLTQHREQSDYKEERQSFFDGSRQSLNRLVQREYEQPEAKPQQPDQVEPDRYQIFREELERRINSNPEFINSYGQQWAMIEYIKSELLKPEEKP